MVRDRSAEHISPIVLATASPRRRRLFEFLGIPSLTTSVDTPEDLDSPLAADPPALASYLAAEKALAAEEQWRAQRLSTEDTAGTLPPLILSFDTIVVIDDEVLGKPTDIEDARRMLELLSGRTHRVTTGVAVLAGGAREPETFAVTTPVLMNALTDDDVDRWVAKGELLGCAGAYNIESHLGSVEADECFQNVAGLPLCHLYIELAERHSRHLSTPPTEPVARCNAARKTRCLLGPRLMSR